MHDSRESRSNLVSRMHDNRERRESLSFSPSIPLIALSLKLIRSNREFDYGRIRQSAHALSIRASYTCATIRSAREQDRRVFRDHHGKWERSHGNALHSSKRVIAVRYRRLIKNATRHSRLIHERSMRAPARVRDGS